MVLQSWLAFVIASSILLLIPGPTILAVISYSITHGRSSTVPLVWAVILGDSTALLMSILGLGTLLAISAFWFTVVKLVGGLYLIYLGIKLFREGISPAEPGSPDLSSSRFKLFANTYIITALNPKGIIFFVAFLPQFVVAGDNAGLQMWVLALTFVFLAAVNAALYSVFAASARRLLDSDRAKKRFGFVGGLLLVIAGTWALLARRPGSIAST